MLQAINASVKKINNEGDRMLVSNSKASGEAFCFRLWLQGHCATTNIVGEADSRGSKVSCLQSVSLQIVTILPMQMLHY
jgi:hypothetical protein